MLLTQERLGFDQATIKVLSHFAVLVVIRDGEVDPPAHVALTKSRRGDVEFSRGAGVFDAEIDLAVGADLPVGMAGVKTICEKDGVELSIKAVDS